MPKQKITTFLWLKSDAEQAAKFYVSLFKNSKIGDVVRYGPAGPGPVGGVMVVNFTLAGQKFIALNGNTHFPITPSISLFALCATQAEVNALWTKLLKKGGKPMACGWITDHFGVTWQIVPDGLLDLIKTPAGMKAMMGQIKLDINEIKRAVKSAKTSAAKTPSTKKTKPQKRR